MIVRLAQVFTQYLWQNVAPAQYLFDDRAYAARQAPVIIGPLRLVTARSLFDLFRPVWPQGQRARRHPPGENMVQRPRAKLNQVKLALRFGWAFRDIFGHIPIDDVDTVIFVAPIIMQNFVVPIDNIAYVRRL